MTQVLIDITLIVAPIIYFGIAMFFIYEVSKLAIDFAKFLAKFAKKFVLVVCGFLHRTI